MAVRLEQDLNLAAHTTAKFGHAGNGVEIEKTAAVRVIEIMLQEEHRIGPASLVEKIEWVAHGGVLNHVQGNRPVARAVTPGILKGEPLRSRKRQSGESPGIPQKRGHSRRAEDQPPKHFSQVGRSPAISTWTGVKSHQAWRVVGRIKTPEHRIPPTAKVAQPRRKQ